MEELKELLTIFMIKVYYINTGQKHLVFLSGGCLHHPDFLFLSKDKTFVIAYFKKLQYNKLYYKNPISIMAN